MTSLFFLCEDFIGNFDDIIDSLLLIGSKLLFKPFNDLFFALKFRHNRIRRILGVLVVHLLTIYLIYFLNERDVRLSYQFSNILLAVYGEEDVTNDMETLRACVAYENANQGRIQILRRLEQRASEIRSQDD
ncbi:hypothetical protein C492_09140 [Natronococcus jeotgali DSM 18795]|uniref:DUF8129 domain-containing protein n=1 Tax=Natronococcus jeotgali DSM 18795 TaxID=1227498 RepID=L9XJC0_9EURY|nr:hypothetical protein C492_09140 [Natronococcus jeotgali DSM 18795]